MARPRIPTNLKIVKGTAQKCRTNPNEPKPELGIPEPPEHLSDRAKGTWSKVSKILLDMGILSSAHGLALEGLCESYADLVSARQALRERGSVTYEGGSEKNGTIYRAYPEVAMASDADRRFRSWLAAFGLTPSDQSRVNAFPDEPENQFQEFA